MRFRRHQEAAEAATTRLLLAFAAVVAVVVVVNALLWAAYRLTLPWATDLPRLFFETNTALVLGFVLGGCWLEGLRLRAGGAHVAQLAGARPAQPAGAAPTAPLERRLERVVQEMALAARVRPPAAWVIARDDRINAFAAGWSEDDAVVAVTRGALERLTRAELQAVVAHEIGHLVRGDARLNMRLLGLVWGLQMVHGFGTRLAEADDRGRRHAGVLFGLALKAVGWVGWLGGRLLQAGVSRQREFLADASAVQYTRQVDGLGGALRKIAGHVPAPSPAPPACLAHLWLVPPSAPAAWRRWLATHPPLAQRLRRLYGHEGDATDALPAPVLPPPRGDEDAPPPAVAALAPMAYPPAPLRVNGPTAPAPIPDAAVAAPLPAALEARHDRELTALQRSLHWRSAGERHAALLALLLSGRDDDPRWPAWQRSTAAYRGAAAVRDEVLAMGPAARWQTLQRLAALTAAEDDRFVLRREALKVVRADAAAGEASRLQWLRLWWLRQALAARPRARTAALPLPALATAAGAATAWLAPLLTAPAREVAAPSLRRALPLRRLHPMQRPLLVKRWLDLAAPRLDDPACAEALALACRLLDSPEPPAVTAALQARR